MSFRTGLGVATTAVLILVGAAVAMAAGTFTDDDGNTHEGNIEAIAAEGITKGCNPPDNTLYCPDDEVSRGEMAAFLRPALNCLPRVRIFSPTMMETRLRVTSTRLRKQG